MNRCAYCGQPCQPTREHVIPRWYSDTPGEAETFSARASLTHLRGDILVKDVCRACNNGPLADLDAYGKELFDRYLAHPVYTGERVTLDLDGTRLIRWLLKLSFNSARAQNADVRVLGEFSKAILGLVPLTGHVRCWLHLVSATCLTPEGGVRPAARADRTEMIVKKPDWFRILQLRLPFDPTTPFVQRQVIINSFAFTLLVAPVGFSLPDRSFDRLREVFEELPLGAVPIPNGRNVVTAAAGADHAAASMYPLFHHHPSRFVSDPSPFIESALRGEKKLLMLFVPRDMIEGRELQPVVEAFRLMVSTRERAIACRQRVGIMVDGYDHDPRGLWQIPEARDFFRALFAECPFVFLLAHPEGRLLEVMMGCWVYETEGDDEASRRARTEDFLLRAFRGLNETTYRLALSRELNREVVDAGMKCLGLESA